MFQPSETYEQRPPLWARYSMELLGASEEPAAADESGTGMRLNTSRGDIHCLVHRPSRADGRAVLWAPGSRGGFRGPADGLYPDLAQDLAREGITSLRLAYRQPGNLEESTLDALAAIWHLDGAGCSRIALVGHSFGGGVVISAARYSSRVRRVAALASQTMGAEDAVLLGSRPLLLAHGKEDAVLPVSNVQTIQGWASGPVRVIIYPGAGHGLRECAKEVRVALREWLLDLYFFGHRR